MKGQLWAASTIAARSNTTDDTLRQLVLVTRRLAFAYFTLPIIV